MMLTFRECDVNVLKDVQFLIDSLKTTAIISNCKPLGFRYKKFNNGNVSLVFLL
jgi:S-adenosylmethionine/arginine decarboxylase-like enzyme